MKHIPSALIIVAILFVGFSLNNKIENIEIPVGSVSVSDEYISTMTGEDSGFGATVSTNLKPAPGVLGSVTITGTATGELIFYNSTTSDVTLRAGATSTLPILAHIPASLAVGTYVFDIEANIGLIVEVLGTQPTTTVTYR